MNVLVSKTWPLALAVYNSIIFSTSLEASERGWSYTYNAKGLMLSSDGPRTDVNDITHYKYDTKGNMTRVTNALGHVTKLSKFDYFGNPQIIIDPNGIATKPRYSSEGLVSSINTSAGATRFEYNAVGDITKIVRGDDSWLSYVWDDARRLILITNNRGEKIEFDIDAMGNRTAIRFRDSDGTLTKQSRNVYDELGRLIDLVGAAGQRSHTKYDLNNNPVSFTNPLNHSQTGTYDSFDRLVENTDALNGATKFEYDAQHNLTQIIDPRGSTTRYQYDGIGNLIMLESPDSGTNTYNYDAAGNMTKRTDARGIVTSFTYDALNRLTARYYPANPELNTRLRYDSTIGGNNGIGRLTSVEDINGELSYTYDAHGNLTAQLQTPPSKSAKQRERLGYGYDDANRLNRIDYPTGFSIVYLRDAAGQVEQVQMLNDTEKSITLLSEIAFMPFGPLKSLTWNNGTTLKRTYDLDYRLTSQTVAERSNTYTYDPIGNINKIKSNPIGELNYSYDALDRLTGEKNAIYQQTFTYDAVGNRKRKTITALANEKSQDDVTTTYKYGEKDNRLIEIDGQQMITDAAGNLIKDNANREFSYNEENRLSSVKIDGIVLAQFSYSAHGQRTQKITSQGSISFIYGLDGELLGETQYDSQGLKLKSQFYIWLEGIPLSGVSVDYDATEAISNTSLFYLHTDHLNTPRIATDAVQELVWEWMPDVFGVGNPTGSLTLNLRFPGQYYDNETDLHYNYFRNYNPKTGRYVESDPIGLKGGLNSYGYANGNPLKYIDPLGMESIFGWSAKAEKEAIESKLPGSHNGPQDAYRHCVASCMIASSNWGETTSRVAGWANEVSNFGQNRHERAMDDWNNQAGICAAKGNNFPENCPKSCMTLLEKGSLITETSSEGAYY
ncbi:RHS repeat-associated core domain-containing protein [Pseudomonas sp. PD9R]|uniref:RHS repeat-associated core domain-containing protein n=1 Tax=Pseudomonas sp. PD9R TaxID=2853534 RepID=UPI001C43C703|nr:RHS repeat-associated core domain-containing protein [Pseudomonas sp. PD9R]MBV6825364.1 RHS repeat protein [Pseudomonas sp. PD9R]